MSTRTLVAMNEALLANVAVSAARPTSASDGVDITHWRVDNQFAPQWAVLFLDGSTAQSIGPPSGGSNGPELWGYSRSAWWRIGYINDGVDVAIAGSSQGFAQLVNVVGICTRLAIAGTPSAGSCNAEFFPVDVWS